MTKANVDILYACFLKRGFKIKIDHNVCYIKYTNWPEAMPNDWDLLTDSNWMFLANYAIEGKQ